MISVKEKRIQEAGTPALLCFKPEELPADCRITSVINIKRVSRPVKPTNRIKCGIRQGLFLNER